MVAHVKVAANGRVCIPADVRARLGIKDGDKLVLDETEEGLFLRTLDQSVRSAQALVRKLRQNGANLSVDDFIAERRREAELEEQRDLERYGPDGI